MRVLLETADYLELFYLAVGFGALGGLGSELLQQARGRPGDLRLLRWNRRAGTFNIGFFGSMILGALAALVVVVFFPFAEVAQNGVEAAAYDLMHVVPLFVVAGAVGSALMGAAHAKAAAAVEADRARHAEATGRAEIERLLEDLPALVRGTVAEAVRPELARIGSESSPIAGNGSVDQVVDKVAQKASAAVEPRVRERAEVAKRAISAAAGR